MNFLTGYLTNESAVLQSQPRRANLTTPAHLSFTYRSRSFDMSQDNRLILSRGISIRMLSCLRTCNSVESESLLQSPLLSRFYHFSKNLVEFVSRLSLGFRFFQ